MTEPPTYRYSTGDDMKDCGHPNHGNYDHDCRPFLPPDPGLRGLYGKYRVEKVNGKPIGRVFVLDYDFDPHAQVALKAYADSCRSEYPQLASDLYRELGLTL